MENGSKLKTHSQEEGGDQATSIRHKLNQLWAFAIFFAVHCFRSFLCCPSSGNPSQPPAGQFPQTSIQTWNAKKIIFYGSDSILLCPEGFKEALKRDQYVQLSTWKMRIVQEFARWVFWPLKRKKVKNCIFLIDMIFCKHNSLSQKILPERNSDASFENFRPPVLQILPWNVPGGRGGGLGHIQTGSNAQGQGCSKFSVRKKKHKQIFFTFPKMHMFAHFFSNFFSVHFFLLVGTFYCGLSNVCLAHFLTIFCSFLSLHHHSSIPPPKMDNVTSVAYHTVSIS